MALYRLSLKIEFQEKISLNGKHPRSQVSLKMNDGENQYITSRALLQRSEKS